MANTIAVGALLTAGLRPEFMNVYRTTYKGVFDRLKDIVAMDLTSDKIQEIYGFLNAAPYPARWDRGTNISSSNMGSVQFTVPNYDWGHRIYIHDNDLQDDQTGSAYPMARQLGEHFATLVERIFFQVMQSTTDPNLLPVIPVAADGLGLYSGSARFGVSTGNQFTASGTSSVAQVQADIYTIIQTYVNFQDTQSQPLFDPSTIRENGFKLIHGPALTLVMEQAEKAMIIPIGLNTATSNAGVSSVLLASGRGPNIQWENNQRITGSSYYSWLKGLPIEKRGFLRQIRQGFFESLGNWEVSDHTRDTGEIYLQYKTREGYGIAVPYNTIKVI
jgi:hypothetical protein